MRNGIYFTIAIAIKKCLPAECKLCFIIAKLCSRKAEILVRLPPTKKRKLYGKIKQLVKQQVKLR